MDPPTTIIEDMRALPVAARKAARPMLRKGGEIIASGVRARASWSSRIPGSVRVSTSFRLGREGVTVHSGGPRAPHARPFETPGMFRVPLFGNRNRWYPHAGRPSLNPAAEAGEPAATALMSQGLGEAAASIGFT